MISQSFGGYGDKINGYPLWQERAILVLTNTCRMSPVEYRDAFVGQYNILLPENYPPVPPLYWNLNLNIASRFHCIQMADTCGMTHNSCNGENFSTRLQKFYLNKSYNIGENIATGNSSPIATMKQWIMDATSGVPAGDLTNCSGGRCDGHRWNIMNKNYKEIGTGYDSGAIQYKYFWCQDFGGGKPEFVNPIVSGVHLFVETGKITFLANYFDTLGKPQDKSLFVDDQEIDMSLLMGNDSAGTYSVVLTRAQACRYYYFSFTDIKGKKWRYPEEGYLVTYGEGSCIKDYISQESLSVNKRNIYSVKSDRNNIIIIDKQNLIEIYGIQPIYNLSLLNIQIIDIKGRIIYNILNPFIKKEIEKYVIFLDNNKLRGVYLVKINFTKDNIINKHIRHSE